MPQPPDHSPGFAEHPDYRIEFIPCPRRVRVVFGGETLADSVAVMVLRETRHTPVYYFPRADVRMDLLRPTDHTTHCPFKGDAAYWSVTAGGRAAENAVWSYEAPYVEVTDIRGYVSFIWNAVDGWYEEDEEIFVHPRDPRKRVDVVESGRRVRVVLGGETVAESTRARFLFETGLRTRYYLPREDVRAGLLEPSPTTTACPYKGRASYYSLRLGETLHEDLVWSYPAPLPECGRIKDLLCFYDERVDAVEVERGTPFEPPPARR